MARVNRSRTSFTFDPDAVEHSVADLLGLVSLPVGHFFDVLPFPVVGVTNFCPPSLTTPAVTDDASKTAASSVLVNFVLCC